MRLNVMVLDDSHHALGVAHFDVFARPYEHEFGRLYTDGPVTVPIQVSGTATRILLYSPELHQRWWKPIDTGPTRVTAGTTLTLCWHTAVLTVSVDAPQQVPSALRIEMAHDQQPEVLLDTLRRFLS